MDPQPVKALSLWQPWAALIQLREQEYETRSWYTLYRGKLVIHAGLSRAGLSETQHDWRIGEVLKQHGITDFNALLFGYALVVCDLVDCIPTQKVFIHQRKFGNFQPGRFAFKLANVQVFPEPIKCQGAPGLWDWTLPLPEGLTR